MQEDMHYYGTYALARAAGLAVPNAATIAYAAQYVDDSTAIDSDAHEDGGMFVTTATAHTNTEAMHNAAADHIEQRKVWVPFHFFPGGEGATFSERLICRKEGVTHVPDLLPDAMVSLFSSPHLRGVLHCPRGTGQPQVEPAV